MVVDELKKVSVYAAMNLTLDGDVAVGAVAHTVGLMMIVILFEVVPDPAVSPQATALIVIVLVKNAVRAGDGAINLTSLLKIVSV